MSIDIKSKVLGFRRFNSLLVRFRIFITIYIPHSLSDTNTVILSARVITLWSFRIILGLK